MKSYWQLFRISLPHKWIKFRLREKNLEAIIAYRTVAVLIALPMKQLVSIGQPLQINNAYISCIVCRESIKRAAVIVLIKYVRILTYNWCRSGRTLWREHHDGVANRCREIQKAIDSLRHIVSLTRRWGGGDWNYGIDEYWTL